MLRPSTLPPMEIPYPYILANAINPSNGMRHIIVKEGYSMIDVYEVLTVADFILAALYYNKGKMTKKRLRKIIDNLAFMEAKEDFFEPCELFDAEYAMLKIGGYISKGKLTKGRREAARVAKMLEEEAPDTARLLRRLVELPEKTLDNLLEGRCRRDA